MTTQQKTRPGLGYVLLALILTTDSDALLAQDAGVGSRPMVKATDLTSASVQREAVVQLDGVLDEAFWAETAPADDFIQREPYAGQPATQITEVRFAFTASRLYVGLTVQAETLIAREQGRDAFLGNDDSVRIILDTFLDRRNAYVFETNGNGARSDALVTDEGRDMNRQWDGVWRVATARTATGYTAEMEIPFSTLRFDPALDRWGLQIVRRVAANYEQALWSPTGRDANELRISLAGTLTGLPTIEASQQFQVKPYVTANADRDRRLGPGDERSEDAELGVDAKWAPTRNLAVDLTVNTDFAEVEVDEQQVNLTRFPLFFPEKREFFLENAGLFDFGPVKRGFDFDPILMKVFFSRRIGLDDSGRTVPIRFGARFTGRLGDTWNVGALGVQTRDDIGERETTEFGVARVVRNLGRRSNIGLIATERRGEQGARNSVLGIDGTYNPTRRLSFRGFATRSEDRFSDSSDRSARDGHSLGFAGNYDRDSWSVSLEGLEVDRDFDPGMGFLLRRDIRFIRPRAQIRTRVEKFGIRNLLMGWSFKYTSQRSTSTMESREWTGDLLGFETFGGSSFFLWADKTTERLLEPFEIRPGIVIDVGRYDFDPLLNFFYFSPQQKRLSFQISGSSGGFFDGDRRSLSTEATYRPNKYLRLSVDRFWAEVDLPASSFTSELVSFKGALSFSPNQRLDAFAQFNDEAELLGLNVRFNWIYRPGADLFVVYNKQWRATSLSNTETLGDQVIVKFTYLFQR